MNNETTYSATHAKQRVKQVDTKVSKYDALNGALVATIALVGFLTTVLFLIWLTTAFEFGAEAAVVTAYEEPFGDEKPEGFDDDVAEPGVEEFPEIEEPALKDALEAVTDAVSSVRASLEQVDGDSAVVGRGSGVGSIDGGDGTGGGDVVGEHNRWQIQYESDDINRYAQQLSFFKIDIGAVSLDSNEIVRVRDPAGALARVKSDRASENKNKTLFFAHKKRRLQRWDSRLAKKAGVNMEGRNTVQFFPVSLRQILRKAEQDHLTGVGRSLSDVGKTYFQIFPEGQGYSFKVVNMKFRRR